MSRSFKKSPFANYYSTRERDKVKRIISRSFRRVSKNKLKIFLSSDPLPIYPHRWLGGGYISECLHKNYIEKDGYSCRNSLDFDDWQRWRRWIKK